MKLSKLEGIRLLEDLEFPINKLIDTNLLNNDSQILKNGISVRTSPKEDFNNNVYLPSIHNCKKLNEIYDFIKQNERQYNIIIHETVKPEYIGSVSQYNNYFETKMSIELFNSFQERKDEIIKNRVEIPVIGGRLFISKLKMSENNEQDFKLFSKVIKYLSNVPFETYDIEFVIQNDEVIFTDLTIKDTNECNKIIDKELYKCRNFGR